MEQESTGATSATYIGDVEDGVEHGSVVFTGDGVLFQLGRACQQYVGHRIELVGYPMPEMLTTAMQGESFHVQKITVLGLAANGAIPRDH